MDMARTGYDFQSLTQENRDWKEARAMSKEIIQFDQAMFETKLDAMVRDKVEQIVNAMLDEEADLIANAARYERSDGRKAYRAGHYARRFTVKAGRLGLKVPKLKGALFESAVIERYRRREQSVEESLIDMYLAGVSTRRVDDISQLFVFNVFSAGARWCVFRQIGVNSVGTYSGHCRRSGWTVWAVGWFPLFVGYFMSEWVFR